METVELIHDSHIERGSCRSFFLISPHMQVVVTTPAVSKPVNQRRVPVIGKDDGLVGGEYRIEFAIRESVWMLARRLQGHQVNDIDDADFYIRKIMPEKVHSRQGLQRRNITRACHDHIRLGSLVSA